MTQRAQRTATAAEDAEDHSTSKRSFSVFLCVPLRLLQSLCDLCDKNCSCSLQSQLKVAYPTDPSSVMPSNCCASSANSIGNSLNTSLQNPDTIIDTACSALSPRCLR